MNAMHKMKLAGMFLFFATTLSCVDQKIKWYAPSLPSGDPNTKHDMMSRVSNHLGIDWTDKVIAIRDKTLLCGHFLIDNHVAPHTTSSLPSPSPTWVHVLFDKPHNRYLDRAHS